MFNHRVLINIFKRGDFLWVFAVFYGNINFILIITLVHTFLHLLLLQAMNLYSARNTSLLVVAVAADPDKKVSLQKSTLAFSPSIALSFHFVHPRSAD